MLGMGALKVESSQDAVLDVVMIQAMGRDNDTVPTALSLKKEFYAGHGDLKGRKFPGCRAGRRDESSHGT